MGPAMKSALRLAAAAFLVEVTGAAQRLTTSLVRALLREELAARPPPEAKKDHGTN